MPIYTYECSKCNCKFETLVSVADRDNLDKIKPKLCPETLMPIIEEGNCVTYLPDPDFTPQQCELRRVVDNFTFKI